VTTASQLLSDIFDRGLRKDARLTRRERELFLIQSFIIDTEMGGLSGFLYNAHSKRGRLEATANALEKYDVKPLAPIARELAKRFHGWRARTKQAQTWEEVLAVCVSDARLALLEERLSNAAHRDYGLERSRVVPRGPVRSGGLSAAR
jgi:hypothetical protein